MAMDTEEMNRAQPMDPVELIGGRDNTLPAQMMAAASVDVPAIVLPTGPMVVGHYRGQVLGACTDCRRLWSQFRAGALSEAEIDAANARLAPSVGTCMVMGTASTMACLAEALGLALAGSASIPATHAERVRCAEATGRRAVAIAGAGPRPSEILTPTAFRNALVVLQAIGGSTNGLIHLTAVAGRLRQPIDLEMVDRLSREVPVLVDLKPSGEAYMEHFHHAGGMPRLLAELEGLVDLEAITVGGSTLRQAVQAADRVPGQTTIRSRSDPVSPDGAIGVLHGNLAPRGAVIKQSAASPRLMQHTGRAVVFESLGDLAARIDAPDLDVKADDVLVLRHAGPKGAPGMPEAGYLPIPKKLAQQGVKDMVRVSDARMSGTAFGTIVLHVTPEAAVGGPLGLVATGDRIRLDVPARRLELLVDEGELARRARQPGSTPPAAMPERGYARLFHASVLQADEGCDFDFLVPPDPSH
jgi:dihydroxy-acid dehydratase